MKIEYTYPPNYEEICQHFDIRDRKSIVFTYGDTLYVPSGIPPSEDLLVHEETHVKQQEFVGGPEIWWKFYLKEPEFRLCQELEAYRQQYHSVIGREYRRGLLNHISKDLSGKMYGNLMTKEQAKAQIKQKVIL